MSVIILGLDGMNLALLEYCREDMPHLYRLLSQSAYGTARGVFPLHSGPAWTSIFTGQGVGRHGFINAFYYDQDMKMQMNNFEDIPEEHFYELISRSGGKIFLMDVPFSTARKIPGDFLDSCFSTKSIKYKIVPENLTEKFPSIKNYINYKSYGKNLNEFIRGFMEIINNNGQIIKEVINSKEYDLMFFQLGIIDWIQHKALIEIKYNPTSKKVKIAKKVIQELDGLIGWVVAHLDNNDHFLVISDHGGAELRGTFFINSWLKKKGYLSLKDNPNKKISTTSILHLLTRFVKSNRLLLNLARPIHRKMIRYVGKEIKWFELIDYQKSKALCLIKNTPIIKILEDNLLEKEKIKKEIIFKLNDDLGFNSKDIIEYYGCKNPITRPKLFRFGDIVIDIKDYELDIFLNNKVFLYGKAMYHDENAIFVAYGPKIKIGKISKEISILDFCPTILSIYGLSVPSGVEGTAMDIFKDEIKLTCPPHIDCFDGEEILENINW